MSRALAELGRAIAITGAIVMAAACAPVPRPDVLGTVESVRSGAAARESRSLAPGAFAHAEKIRREALAAGDADDLAGAQILAERAIAAYAHAHALARVARAEAAAHAAEDSLVSARKELAALEADQARVAAELDALELRGRVVRDAQPFVPSGPADPAREKGRLAAARSMALQARLLCGAARLLAARGPVAAPAMPPAASPPASPAPTPAPAPPSAGSAASTAPDAQPAVPAEVATELDAATTALAQLDAELAGTPAATPIDRATRVRAGCLAALTRVRRISTPISRAPGAGDALLGALSAAGAPAPSRDDRGVVVALRGVFEKDGLSREGAARIAELGKVAAANPTFPLLVVVHDDKPTAPDAGRVRGEAVARALVAASGGAPRSSPVEVIAVGAGMPVVDPGGKDRARNARVEIVFVTPEAF